MSNQALSFIGRLDRREESIVMNQLQEQKLVDRLLGNRDRRLVNNLYGRKRVRDVYSPPPHTPILIPDLVHHPLNLHTLPPETAADQTRPSPTTPLNDGVKCLSLSSRGSVHVMLRHAWPVRLDSVKLKE